MDFLKSLIFVPENAKYLSSLDDIDNFVNPSNILKKRINENPYNRNLIKRKIKGKKISSFGKSEKIKVEKTKTETVPISMDNREKNYIKNLTKSPIIIITDEISDSGRNKGYPKAIHIKEYMPKSDLTEKDLKNINFLNLYKEGKIIDITYSEYKEGMKKVFEEKERLMSLKEASIDENIIDSKSIKKIGGVARIGEGSGSSIADLALNGDLYSEDSDVVINLSSAERGPSLERELREIELSKNADSYMSESEIRNIMGKF